MQPLEPKKARGISVESAGGIHRDLEWVKSTCTQESLEGMVIEGTLSDQVTEGWRLAVGADNRPQ